MKFDPISEDPIRQDRNHPAGTVGFVIPAKTGERMSACLFRPQGRGPHPTVLLLHGYPGDENNYDLAHAFQRTGFTTVIFHYRGTWGSEGRFSLGHVLEDTASAVAFIRGHDSDEPSCFDAERLILIGHSMGGFAALETAARDACLLGVAAVAAFDFSLAAGEKSLRETVEREFSDCLPIHSVGLENLLREIDENTAVWSFPALAERLSSKPVFLIGGTKDRISVPQYHLRPLCDSLRDLQGARVESALLEDGHCFSNTRIALARKLLTWMTGLTGRPTSRQTAVRQSTAER